jgi:hypothetical protein
MGGTLRELGAVQYTATGKTIPTDHPPLKRKKNAIGKRDLQLYASVRASTTV